MSNQIEEIRRVVRQLGYDMLKASETLAKLELDNGYSIVEVATHISMVTFTRDIKEDSSSGRCKLNRSIARGGHAAAIMDILADYFVKNLIHPAQYQNDIRAIRNIAIISEHQYEWVDKVLEDEISGKERLAICRIDYDNPPK